MEQDTGLMGLRRMRQPLPRVGSMCSLLSIILIKAVFSVCPVFMQHDAAQLYLTLWNLVKMQIKDQDLVRTVSEMNSRLFSLCHMRFLLLL